MRLKRHEQSVGVSTSRWQLLDPNGVSLDSLHRCYARLATLIPYLLFRTVEALFFFFFKSRDWFTGILQRVPFAVVPAANLQQTQNTNYVIHLHLASSFLVRCGDFISRLQGSSSFFGRSSFLGLKPGRVLFTKWSSYRPIDATLRYAQVIVKGWTMGGKCYSQNIENWKDVFHFPWNTT